MTTPLLVTLPCHAGDVDRAETLLRWIHELGDASEHSLLVAADAGVPQERVRKMLDVVRGDFNSVRAMIVQTGVVGWPLAANLMFRAAARQVFEGYKLPFVWLESDAVPLCEGWLDQLGEAYRKCPRPLMGTVLNAERPIEGLPNRYLAGVAIYPQDTFGLLATRWEDPKFKGMAKPPKLGTAQWQQNVRAWDMVFADTLVPRAHNTPLIQNHWGTDYNEPPLFVTARTEADPPNAVTLDFVRKDAVLFHRVKALEEFLPMWRVRMGFAAAVEAMSASVAALPTEAPSATKEGEPPVGFKGTGESNPNFRGGDATLAERRKAAAQRSKDYLEASKRKAQEQAEARRGEPASV